MARKKIKKVSVATVDPITGSIVDGTNIVDKSKNTYSANTIEQLLAGTTLYESETFASTGNLSESINNFKRIGVYAFNADGQNIYQEMLVSSINSDGNLVTSFINGSIASINDATFYGKTARLYMNDKTFTLDRCFGMNIKSGSMTITSLESFIIKKIVGYKF